MGEFVLLSAVWFVGCLVAIRIAWALLGISGRRARQGRRANLTALAMSGALLIASIAGPVAYYRDKGPIRLESDPVARVEIIQRFGRDRNQASVRYIVPALTEDGDARVRAAAACALGEIGSAQGFQPLLKTIEATSDERDVLICALKSIKQFGDVVAVPVLLRALQATRDSTRVEVIRTLGVLKSEAALPALFAIALAPSKGDDRREAVAAVASFGAVALPEVVKQYNGGRVFEAIDIMEDMGDVSAKVLVDVVRTSASKDIRAYATRALLRTQRPTGIDAMRAAMATNLKLVADAYEALIELGDESFLPLLIRTLNSLGSSSMAVAFLNCGEPRLEDAAKRWARAHGYEITTGFGGGGKRWGRR